MSETTQSERRVLRGHTAKGRPGDSIPLSRKMIGKLVNDADRLARLEDGIRALAESLDNDELRLPTGSGTYRQGVDNGYNLASQHAARKIYALLDGE